MNNIALTLLTLVFILIFSLPVLSQQWDETNVTHTHDRYDDIYFHNADLGWAVQGSGLIIKTVDGGNSWVEVYNNPNHYFRSVEFLNEEVGFAGTLDSFLFKTIDGGATWLEIQDLIPTPIPGICGLSHIDNNIYGVGLYAYPAYFIKSTDQGLTWTYSDLSDYADGLVECHFIDANIGFIAGIKKNSGGIILKTTDGGDNWSVVLNTQNGTEYIWKIDFVTDQIAYGAIESFIGNFSSRIVKTTDGGDNWTIHVVDNLVLDLQGIGFINQDTGWVGPRHAPMYETTDGGLTWNRTNLYTNINRFFRVNSNLIYASGSSIYKYDNVGTATQREPDYISSHAISTVTPNPFSTHASFSIKIDRPTTIRLDLFNSTAQHIENFYSGRITKGEHSFELNSQRTQNIPDGIYYIVLRTNEGFITTNITKSSN